VNECKGIPENKSPFASALIVEILLTSNVNIKDKIIGITARYFFQGSPGTFIFRKIS